MPVTTSQQITRYYNTYRDIDVTFTKEVIKAMGIIPKQIIIKCVGYQFPCIIYSCSMKSAKVIANTSAPFNEVVKRANNLVNLRFGIKQSEKQDPVYFYVSTKITGYIPYGKEKPNLYFINLAFTHRPPDDLIDILGQMLEANANSQKRKEERIIITPNVMRKLRLKNKETIVYIQGVPRQCIIRDLSFSGAKVIIMGVAKFLVNKEAILKISLDDPQIIITLKGKVIRYETVEGRKEIAAIAIQYDEEAIPMNYKMRINDYLNQVKHLKS